LWWELHRNRTRRQKPSFVSRKSPYWVALVRGVPMPLVLRNYGEEDRERYKIIGPAFVSGLMEGELRDQNLADIALV
jgi:hypothetical protein